MFSGRAGKRFRNRSCGHLGMHRQRFQFRKHLGGNCSVGIHSALDFQVQESYFSASLSPVSLKRVAAVDEQICVRCGNCAQVCPFNAIIMASGIIVNTSVCKGCGVCVKACPTGAIQIREVRK